MYQLQTLLDLKQLHDRTSRDKSEKIHVRASRETKQRTKSLILESESGSDGIQDQKAADEGKASHRKIIEFY